MVRPRHGVVAVLLVLVIGLFTADSARAEVSAATLSTVLGRVTGPTVRALDAGTVPGGGRDGRYLVTWDDPVSLGSQGVGLLNELERRASPSE